MNVTYISACLDTSGYAEAARNHIAALDSVGVKIDAVPVSFENYKSDLGKLGELIRSMIKTQRPGDIQIIHMTPDGFPNFIKPDKYNIGYCTWETNKLPPKWVPLINALDEVWVPCEYNKTMFESSGVTVPIFVMPHPFNSDYYTPSEETVISNTGTDDYLFYSIFQWTERKNPTALLRAYLTEFSKEDKVALVIKTYSVNPNNIEERKQIKNAILKVKAHLHLKSYPKILLVTSLLSRAQLQGLHTDADCYVSLHRCEGFGIPIAEAMLSKNPCIVTNYGGPADFCTTQSLIPYMETPVYGMPWDHYTGDMLWAEADILSAKARMREMYEHREFASRMGERGYEEIIKDFSWEAVGNKMKNRLEEISKERSK